MSLERRFPKDFLEAYCIAHILRQLRFTADEIYFDARDSGYLGIAIVIDDEAKVTIQAGHTPAPPQMARSMWTALLTEIRKPYHQREWRRFWSTSQAKRNIVGLVVNLKLAGLDPWDEAELTSEI